MPTLIPVETRDDIPSHYVDTPIGLLLEYHNLKRPHEGHESAQLLAGMCMDSRKHLHIPENFAFVLRAGGANFRSNEFKISFAVAVGGVKHVALIGHTQCGMVNLQSRKLQFIDGLVERAGWHPEKAEAHFEINVSTFEIGDEIEFILSEVARLRARYPKITIVPMMYKVEDNQLYLIEEELLR